MKTSRAAIAQAVAGHTLKNGASKDYTRQIASLLLSENRTGELDSLMRDVQADWAKHGFVEAIVTSAHPLTDKIKADITQQVKKLYATAQKVIISEIHDPDIIGGVRVNLPHQQLDLSVEAKLNSLKGLTI